MMRCVAFVLVGSLLGLGALGCGSGERAGQPVTESVAAAPLEADVPTDETGDMQHLQLTEGELARLREVAATRPNDAAAQHELALGLKRSGYREAAIPHFERAAQLAPGEERHLLDLALAYSSVARLSDAEQVYRQLLDSPGLRAIALHNLGNIALRLEQLDRAIGYYKQALAVQPDHLLARYHLGVALQEAGRFEEARESFMTLLRSAAPPRGGARDAYYDTVYLLANMDLATGQPARAAQLLTKLIEAHPEHPNAHFAYARALLQMGREEEAQRALQVHARVPDRAAGRLGFLGAPSHAPAAPGKLSGLRFDDVTAQAGIRYQNVCGAAPQDKGWLMEEMGAGAAWLDYDGDGILDIYFVNGSTYDRSSAAAAEPNQLYRGDGKGHFSDVTAQAGVPGRDWGYGVAVGDIDNDGDPDLYVTTCGTNVLYRNAGGGRFTDVTQAAGVGGGGWGTSAAFFDIEPDGDLDLYVANYMECDPAKVPRKGETRSCTFKGIDVSCGPKEQPPAQDSLYRNNGDGTFTDVTREAGVWLATPRYALGVVVADYDNDGLQDIYVANDSVPSCLWRNQGNGTFVDVGLETLSAVSGSGRSQAGMGTDFGDFNGDGWLDIVVTTFSHDLKTIFRNVGGKFFSDDSAAVGMGVTFMTLSWGTGFYDFDCDADEDLFIANGHVYPEVDARDMGTSYRQRNHLFINQGDGRLLESSAAAGPGFQVERSFRGAAFADYDNDGDVDILVTALDEPALLLNNGSARRGHYLTIALQGTRSNRDGVGARVTVVAQGRTQIRERKGGGSYLSASDPRLHFGLGKAERVERIEVRWPSGLRDVVHDVKADQMITLVEGRGATP